MANQPNMNQVIDGLKTSINSLNDTIRNYNVKQIDTFSMFENLNAAITSFATNLNANLTSINQDLSDNVNNLKDFGKELNKLTDAAKDATQKITAASMESENVIDRSNKSSKTKETTRDLTQPPPIPDEKKPKQSRDTTGMLTNLLGPFKTAFKFVSKVIEIGIKSIAAFNAAILASIVTFQMFTNRVKSYVQAYNPNLVKQFDYVLKDITAVIGKALQPVLIALGAALRQFGDILVPLMDVLAPTFQAIANAVSNFLLPIFNALGNALRNASPIINKLAGEFAKLAGELGQVIAENMPDIIAYLIDYLRNWVESLKAYNNVAGPFIKMWTAFNRAFLQAGNILLGAFNRFAEYMKKIALKLRSWLDWFGITTKGKNYVGTTVEPATTGNSTGMAAREAEYMNVEDLSRGLIKAAYGSGQDIQRQQLEQQRMMNGQLAEINQRLGRQNVGPQPVQAGLRMA